MSYCSIQDLLIEYYPDFSGRDASDELVERQLRYVEAAADVINNYIGFNGVYQPDDTFWSQPLDTFQFPGNQWRIRVAKPVVSLNMIEAYVTLDSAPVTVTANIDSLDSRIIVLDDPPAGWETGWLKIQGDTGYAKLVSLATGTEVVAGNTIVDNANVVTFVTSNPYTSVDGDQLAVVPRLLNILAVGVAQRTSILVTNQYDTAVLDAGSLTELDNYK